MTEEVEHCWFLYGIRIKNRFWGFLKFEAIGTSASVGFNWKKGMSRFCLGWLHTHPSEYGTIPSDVDERTMRSWVKALGRPMICGIACDEEVTWYDYNRAEDRSISQFRLEVDKRWLFLKGKN